MAQFCDRGHTDSSISETIGMDPGLSYFSGKIAPLAGLRGRVLSTILWRHPAYWEDLVSAYRERKLTLTDALVGISAVAEVYGNSGTYGRYCAGLWETAFVRQLAWYVTRPGRAHQHELGNSVPHDGPRFHAPSWSWASKDEEVDWAWIGRSFAAQAADCRVLEIQAEPQKNSAPFGNFKPCRVRLHGRLKEATWYSAEEDMVVEDPRHGKRVTCNGVRAYPDTQPVGPTPEEDRKVYCFELFPLQRVSNFGNNLEMSQKSWWLPKSLQKGLNYFCGALILAKDQSSGDFDRVGYLTRDFFDFNGNQPKPPENADWWREGWESRDITIV